MAPPASVLASTKRGRGRPRKQRTTHTHCGTTNTTFQSIDVSMPLPSSPSQPPEQPRKKRGRPSQKVNGSQCGKQNQPSITSWYSSLTDQTINRAECEASERITGRKQIMVGLRRPDGFERGYTVRDIVGVSNEPGELCFFVQWHEVNEVELIRVSMANQKCPDAVREYYSRMRQWSADACNFLSRHNRDTKIKVESCIKATFVYLLFFYFQFSIQSYNDCELSNQKSDLESKRSTSKKKIIEELISMALTYDMA